MDTTQTYQLRKSIYQNSPVSPTLTPYHSPVQSPHSPYFKENGIPLDVQVPSRFCLSPPPEILPDFDLSETTKSAKWKKRLSMPFQLTQKAPPKPEASKVPNFTFLKTMITTKLSQNYSLTETELGRGVSGTVFLVKRNKDDQLLAAKVTTRAHANGKKYSLQKQLNKMANEVLLLSRLHHENIIKTTDLVTHNGSLAIIMEYCPTNLFTLVKHHTLTPAVLHNYFCQISAGVAYLHNEVGIAHRDLKLENICIGMDGLIKLVDFGSAVHFATTFPSGGWKDRLRPMTMTTNPRYSTSSRSSNFVRNSSSSTNTSMSSRDSSGSGSNCSNTKFQLGKLSIHGLCGSDPYIAPEIWTSLSPHTSRVGYDPRQADLWSMGVILTAMHSGRFPWACAKTNDPDFSKYRTNPTRYLQQFGIPHHHFILAVQLLTLNEDLRPTIDDIMSFLS
ncbi:kinase-like protein [Conidiobolus coronatus NRRL 28638]|uniref:Kinase-like protein n=1 Tax=Conidiobolus coronatus (strain ATCC 28846 / CBS 209.66 / NRRL 28638) TaxID=796925 RepID=A0A137NWI4_CONC2|nr:kinase-like protein [Conidiobolus coronatus NRRL 28638]|eukprot:KXN67048.1 kinase-like protein [Conidiobolus coronatus NRRL 28638]